MAASGEQGGLPSEYQQVEYIGANGYQYISWTLPTPFEIGVIGFSVEYYITSRANQYSPCVIRTVTLESTNGILFMPRTRTDQGSGGSINVVVTLNGKTNYSVSSDIYSSLNTWHKCEANFKHSGIISHNGTKTNDARGADDPTTIEKVEIMRNTSDNNIKFNGRIKNLKISREQKEILSFVPCYRKSDGVIGMFETHTQTFLTNSGSDAFSKGADVN